MGKKTEEIVWIILAAVVFLFCSFYPAIVFGAARGSGSYTTYQLGPSHDRLYLPVAWEDRGAMTGSTQSVNNNFIILSSTVYNYETYMNSLDVSTAAVLNQALTTVTTSQNAAIAAGTTSFFTIAQVNTATTTVLNQALAAVTTGQNAAMAAISTTSFTKAEINLATAAILNPPLYAATTAQNINVVASSVAWNQLASPTTDYNLDLSPWIGVNRALVYLEVVFNDAEYCTFYPASGSGKAVAYGSPGDNDSGAGFIATGAGNYSGYAITMSDSLGHIIWKCSGTGKKTITVNGYIK